MHVQSDYSAHLNLFGDIVFAVVVVIVVCFP